MDQIQLLFSTHHDIYSTWGNDKSSVGFASILLCLVSSHSGIFLFLYFADVKLSGDNVAMQTVKYSTKI